jgi:PAS domain-containing protein
MPLPLETVALNGPHALRALARAFGQFDNFDRFVAALEGALPRATGFDSARIVLDRALVDSAERFSPGLLALPLTTEAASLGRLQVGAAGERRQFSADDLHLLAGLADFLGAVLGQAQRLQDAARSRELLRLLLNQAPVGIAAYTLDRRPIVANELALRWLGGTALPFAELEEGGDSFYLRTEGKLVYGEARRVAEVTGGAWVFVFHDLTPEQARLLDGLQREIYRAVAEKTPRSVALLEVADLSHGALRRLAALRAALQPGELAGPYDAHRIGLVLAENGLGLRARLRQLRPIFDDLAGVRVGYAELGRDGRTPEALLDAALRRYGTFGPMLQPALLIHDENPAVAATLAMVLGREYRVVRSADAARSRELLDAEPFEGIIAEFDPDRERGSDSIVRFAQAVQPGIKTFFTSVQPLDAAGLPPGAMLIEKPFDVGALTARVREQLRA